MDLVRPIILIGALATCSASTIEFFGQVNTIIPLESAGGVEIGDPFYAFMEYVLADSEIQAQILTKNNPQDYHPIPNTTLWAVLLDYRIDYPWGQSVGYGAADDFGIFFSEALEPVGGGLISGTFRIDFKLGEIPTGSWNANAASYDPPVPEAFFAGPIDQVNRVWETFPVPEPSSALLVGAALLTARIAAGRFARG